MEENKIILPKNISAWTRPDSPRLITSKNIFDYMNGAGELYLGYHFKRLEVYEYKSKDENDILLELYFMESSDDSFGLLSLDWEGEPVIFDRSINKKSNVSNVPSVRALYGKGLLRIWSGNLYVRIMAVRDTSAAKDAILQLGKIITTNREDASPPKMLNILSPSVPPDWTLRKDKVSYFHSHLILNSLYYLSHKNILRLNHSTEAVFASYERILNSKDRHRIQLLAIKYPDSEKAIQAIDSFQKTYLPEYNQNKPVDLTGDSTKFFKIEDGWLGYRQQNRSIAVVFECPDMASAQAVINQPQFQYLFVVFNVHNPEARGDVKRNK